MTAIRYTSAVAVAAFLVLPVRHVRANTYTYAAPSEDRWHYPFNPTPGIRPIASTFGAAGDVDFPEFNNRDGAFIIAWDTSSQIPTGLGAQGYDLRAITVILSATPNVSWPIDTTEDEWYTFNINLDDGINLDGVPHGSAGDVDGESSDDDPGRPIELFGAGFGPFTSYETWNEFTQYYGTTCTLAGNCTMRPRDPFPFVYREGDLAIVHVEDSVSGRYNEGLNPPLFSFTPTAWAVGTPIDYVPGSQTAPFDTVFPVNLELSQGAVRGYFQEQINHGRIVVIITSLFDTFIGGAPGEFPTFFTKEGAPLEPGAYAPRLIVELGAAQLGDANGDGMVTLADYASFADCLAGPDEEPGTSGPQGPSMCRRVFDSDADGDVDLRDYSAYQNATNGL